MSRLLVALVISVVAVSSQATLTENFDSYADGTQIHGISPWEGWGGDPAAGALVTSLYSASGPNSLAIAAGSDLVANLSGYVGGQWVITANTYVPTEATGNNYFILMDGYASGNDWAAQVLFEAGNDRIVDADNTAATVPLVRDAWVELRADIDLDANTLAISYGGTPLVVSRTWSAENKLTIEAIDLYNDGGASTIYYDDIRVIPEPASLVLLGLGGLLVAFRRNRG